MKYVCDVCGWEYDEEKGYPEGGIALGTKWEDIPDDFGSSDVASPLQAALKVPAPLTSKVSSSSASGHSLPSLS